MNLGTGRAARRIAGRCAATVVGVAAATASASVAAGPDAPIPVRSELATACLATLKAPKLLTPSPVALPEAVWERQLDARALVSFRLDRQGHPTGVIATVAGVDKDTKPLLERAVVDAFGNYVFCPAGDFSTTLAWTARLEFSPAPAAADVGLYLQAFVPGYPGFGRFERHVGRVVVRATYGVDGRPRFVQMIRSSGDKLLDDQSLDVMASAQILFRNGVAPSKPISVERPFTYPP